VIFMITELYIKYIPGSEYLNFTVSGVSEICAHLSTGLLFSKLGARNSYLIGFVLALAGGVCLIFMDRFQDNIPLLALFVVLAKFGASMCMCVCYICTPWVFPTLLCGTAFGICNVFGRLCQAVAP
jgi:Na+/melibiose symporter-like transporter